METMEMSRGSLEGRHVAITGAGSGIGLATARLFAQVGAKVALLDRDAVVKEIAPTLKGAVAVVTDVSSQESVDAPDIRVNAVCPGVVDTPMLRKAWPDAASLAQVTSPCVIKSLPSAEDIAYSILFLTSDASRHITGTTLASDGGSSLH
jgi:NAD(P)-dependent dehydrogenase (short-subunit alcohol dehydrogenase family)